MVALVEVRDTSTNLDDYSGAFVTHHNRQWMRPITTLQMQITMAHTSARDLHLHLTRTGRRNIDLENFNGLIR
jgi:hypothetical protein